VLLMALASVLGGGINHFFYAERKDRRAARKSSMWACILVSAGAAFLVPLFLNMIASSLVVECEKEPQKYLVFFGVCVIAAISARAFIGSLSAQVLDRLRRTEEEIEEVKPLVGAIAHKVKEPHEGQSAAPHAAADEGVSRGHDKRLDEVVLDRLSESGYVFRTLESVANSAHLDANACESVLRELRAAGLVDERNEVDGVRWYLTPKGWETLELGRTSRARNGSARTAVG
jgi:predicted transcriptional regulator